MTEGGTWSRKENKPSQSEPVFSRRGPDMCLVMQQSPHQPKLGLTEVIKQRSKGGTREKRRGAVPSLRRCKSQSERYCSAFRGGYKTAAVTCSHKLTYKENNPKQPFRVEWGILPLYTIMANALGSNTIAGMHAD